MKAYADQHPGDKTNLGDGTYFENTNIHEITDPENGDMKYEFDAELKVWPVEPTVPVEVYAWRLRLSTQISGLKPSIDALLENLPDPEKTIAKEAWNAGVTIRRDSPLVAQLAGALSLTDEQVDNLFLEANAIEI